MDATVQPCATRANLHDGWGRQSPRVLRRARSVALAGLVLTAVVATADAASIVMTRIPALPPALTRADDATPLPTASHLARCTIARGGEATILTPRFHAAGRADVSFDGTRILFVGRQHADQPFSAWEMSADGSGLREVVRVPGRDITRAIYLSTLYTLDAIRPAPRIALVAVDPRHHDNGYGTLYTCARDGGDLQRIAFNPRGDRDPHLLRDGRIVTSSRDARGDAAALMSVFPDGADVALFAASGKARQWCEQPCETPDGIVYYLERPSAKPMGGGTLCTVDSANSLTTRRVVSRAGSGMYRSPAPLDGQRLLVAYRARAQDTYGIYTLDRFNDHRMTKVTDSPAFHELDARVIAARPVPAGRSSVVDALYETGELYCLNAYLSGSSIRSTVSGSAIKRLQVFAADASHVGGSRTIAERLLGEVALEDDGSFYLQVPARTPLRVRMLTATGAVADEMHSWIWVMPRERRGCMGCHEDRTLSPPNLRVSALRQQPHRFSEPRDAD